MCGMLRRSNLWRAERAYNFGAKWSWRKCTLKSDYLSMARLLQQPFIQRSSLHPIREATEVRGVFQELIVKHTRREQNGVAHEHTQFAKRVVHVAV